MPAGSVPHTPKTTPELTEFSLGCWPVTDICPLKNGKSLFFTFFYTPSPLANQNHLKPTNSRCVDTRQATERVPSSLICLELKRLPVGKPDSQSLPNLIDGSERHLTRCLNTTPVVTTSAGTQCERRRLRRQRRFRPPWFWSVRTGPEGSVHQQSFNRGHVTLKPLELRSAVSHHFNMPPLDCYNQTLIILGHQSWPPPSVLRKASVHLFL